MAHHEPALFTTLRLKQNAQRSEWEYPFAVAGVNITFMLVGAGSCNSGSVQKGFGIDPEVWLLRS